MIVSMRRGMPGLPEAARATSMTSWLCGAATTRTSSIPLNAHSASTQCNSGRPPTGNSSLAWPPVSVAMRVPFPQHGIIARLTGGIYSDQDGGPRPGASSVLGPRSQYLCLLRANFGRRRQHRERAILGDQLRICNADRTDATIQIVEADGVNVVALDAQRMLPIDLIGQREPGEAHHRNARAAE